MKQKQPFKDQAIAMTDNISLKNQYGTMTGLSVIKSQLKNHFAFYSYKRKSIMVISPL